MTQARAFWVTLYLLIEPDSRVHSFLHHTDMVDNFLLASELGQKVYNTKLVVLCTEDFMPDVFRSIIEYENVLKSEGLEKPKRKYTFTEH